MTSNTAHAIGWKQTILPFKVRAGTPPRRVHSFPELEIMRIEYLDMEGWLGPALFRYYNGS